MTCVLLMEDVGISSFLNLLTYCTALDCTQLSWRRKVTWRHDRHISRPVDRDKCQTKAQVSRHIPPNRLYHSVPKQNQKEGKRVKRETFHSNDDENTPQKGEGRKEDIICEHKHKFSFFFFFWTTEAAFPSPFDDFSSWNTNRRRRVR